MERFVVINWTVLCVSILLFEIVFSVSPHDSHRQSIRSADSGESRSHFWFGPRWGRKKRNSASNDYYDNIQKEGLAKLIIDTLQDAPWPDVIAVNDGKRHVVNFTPRLGRESGEELINGLRSDENQWLQDSSMSEEMLYQRSPPFAPRLGRHSSPFLPRLGRDNDKMSFS